MIPVADMALTKVIFNYVSNQEEYGYDLENIGDRTDKG